MSNRSTFEMDWLRWRALLAREEMRPAWLVFVLSLTATLMFWNFARSEDHRATETAFQTLTTKFIAEIEQTMTANEQVLRAGVGLFRTQLHVTKEDWHGFVDALELAKRYPGARGVGYAMMVNPKDLAQHELAFKAIQGPQYEIYPRGQRDVYSAIVFLEPADSRNQRALGYDMYSEPTRREAMERARDSGMISATGKVRLVQETDEDKQTGFLVYAPVYRNDAAPASIDDRRSALEGFVYSPIRLGDFINGLTRGSLAGITEQMRIEIFDNGTEDPINLMFDSLPDTSPRVAGDRLEVKSLFDQNGRSWLLRFTALPAFEISTSSRNPWFVLAIGATVTFLLTTLAASLAIRHVQEAEANAQMALLTRELSHRVKNTLAIVQSIANRSLSGDRTIVEAREIFTKRLHALARAHTLLLNNAWSGADLRDLVTAELSAFGARAVVRGPHVRLKPQVAQTFALVVHELATNAVKHGALSKEGGRVIVEWWADEEASEPIFSFNWREIGGPAVREPARSGFGQTLLRQALVYGSAQEPVIEFTREGFRYHFEAPLTGITAAYPESGESKEPLPEPSPSDSNPLTK